MSLPRKLTRDEILAATKEELRIAIAKQLGCSVSWNRDGHPICDCDTDFGVWPHWDSTHKDGRLYDWPNDIEAVYALEEQFTDYTSRRRYWSNLSRVVSPSAAASDSERGWALLHATAEQRCRAWMLVKHEG